MRSCSTNISAFSSGVFERVQWSNPNTARYLSRAHSKKRGPKPATGEAVLLNVPWMRMRMRSDLERFDELDSHSGDIGLIEPGSALGIDTNPSVGTCSRSYSRT